MNIVIVPDALRDAINKKLDAAITMCPDAIKDRDIFYHQLLEYFDIFGELPDIELVKHEENDSDFIMG
jgi:hypothetical protein